MDYDDPGKAAEYQDLLNTINEVREQGSRLDDQTIARLFRDRLHSKPCQNQGFILDGYPKTTDQAKELFSLGTSGGNVYTHIVLVGGLVGTEGHNRQYTGSCPFQVHFLH